MEHVWKCMENYGTCMEHVWNMYGNLWKIMENYGTCMEHVWKCMENYGTCMEIMRKYWKILEIYKPTLSVCRFFGILNHLGSVLTPKALALEPSAEWSPGSGPQRQLRHGSGTNKHGVRL